MPNRNNHSLRGIMQRDVLTATPEATVERAVKKMCDRKAGSIVVLNHAGNPVGIFTERDLLRLFAKKGHQGLFKKRIGRVMTPDPVVIDIEADFQSAFNKMQRCKCRHLLVMEDGRLAGIVSIKDMVRLRSAMLEQMVEKRTLQLSRTKDQLSKSLSILKRDLKTAGELQQCIVGQNIPLRPKVGFSMVYRQAESLGGDYFELIEFDKSALGIFLADVSGHGPTSALISLLVKMHLSHAWNGDISTAAAARLISGKLYEQIPEEYFAAGFFGVIDPKKNEMIYTCFGAPAPFLFRRKTGERKIFQPCGLPLGMSPEAEYAEKRVKLTEGDAIVLFTDGCTDQFDARKEQFGEDRLNRSLLRHLKKTPERAAEKTYEDIQKFAGKKPQTDDISILIANYGRRFGTKIDKKEKTPAST